MKHWDVVITHASGVTLVHSFEDREIAHSYADSLDDERFPWVDVREVFTGTKEGKWQKHIV